MKLALLCSLFAIVFISCSGSSSKKQKEWTEKQEIHFYKDCKNKLLTNQETEERAHRFCECCLLKLKERYPSGEEAMKNLTNEQIAAIESDCQK